MEEEKVKRRWKEYFRNLLNRENPRKRRAIRTELRERDVEDISGEKVKTGLRKMKKGKAQGPDDIPVEAWIALRIKGVEFVVNFFNRHLIGEMMPDEWRGRGLLERAIEARKRKKVTIAEQQFGFMP